MENYISAYEYENNVNPCLTSIPVKHKNIDECIKEITFIDNSEIYNVDFKSTTPNLLASFIKLRENQELIFEESQDYNASSHFFYIINGNVEFIVNNEKYTLESGDIIITPLFNHLKMENKSTSEVQVYYINDSPLINYLGSKPMKKNFETAIYSKDFLAKNLLSLSNINNNRKGILLSNVDTEKIGTNTITPVLWALYNELPPNTIQKPHKHNSVALDLCISCSDSDNVYTLVGDTIDENGNIINPMKINWKQGEMFITPPGLWHSHNNVGNTYAYILPIQDAGLLLYQRILGIKLYH